MKLTILTPWEYRCLFDISIMPLELANNFVGKMRKEKQY